MKFFILIYFFVLCFTSYADVKKIDIDTTAIIKEFEIKDLNINYFNGDASNSYFKGVNFITFNDRLFYSPYYFGGQNIDWFRFSDYLCGPDGVEEFVSLKDFSTPFFSLKYMQSGMNYIFFGIQFSRPITDKLLFSIIANGAKNDSGDANFWYNVPNKNSSDGTENKYYSSKNGELSVHIDFRGDDFFSNKFHLMTSNFFEEYTKESWRLNSYENLTNYYSNYDSNYVFLENKYNTINSGIDSTISVTFVGLNYEINSLTNTSFKMGSESRESQFFSKYYRKYLYIEQPFRIDDYLNIMFGDKYEYLNLGENYHKNHNLFVDADFNFNNLKFKLKDKYLYNSNESNYNNLFVSIFYPFNDYFIDFSIFKKNKYRDYFIRDKYSINIPIKSNSGLVDQVNRGLSFAFFNKSIFAINGEVSRIDNYISPIYNKDAWIFINYIDYPLYHLKSSLNLNKTIGTYSFNSFFRYSDYYSGFDIKKGLSYLDQVDNYRFKFSVRIGKVFKILYKRLYGKIFIETNYLSSVNKINYISDSFKTEPDCMKFNFYSNISIKQFDLFFNIYNFTNTIVYNDFGQIIEPLKFKMGLDWRLFK